MARSQSKIVLRACRSTLNGPINGYRLALESAGLDDVVLSTIRFDNVGGPIAVSEITHNHAWNVLCTKPDAAIAQAYASDRLTKLAEDYCRSTGLPYESINE